MADYMPQNTGRGRGKRGGKIPAGQPQMSRNDRRAYEYNTDKHFAEDWTLVKDPEERAPTRGRPTSRSQNFRGRGKSATKPAAPDMDFRARTETPPKDTPIFGMAANGASIPSHENYAQNFDFSGFITLLSEQYELFRSVSNRVTKDMPFSMFQHYCCTVLHTHLIDRTIEQGRPVLDTVEFASDLLPAGSLIPKAVYDYIKAIGDVITADGDKVSFNYPPAAVPQQTLPAVGFPSGTFGPPIAANHNAYEAYIAPRVTANRVLASLVQPPAPWVPIPAGALVPTQNLLGFGPSDALNAEGLDRINGCNFANDDTLKGRLCFSDELMSRVNTGLAALQKGAEIVELGQQEGALNRRIPTEPTPANLAWVVTLQPGGLQDRLRDQPVTCRSMSAFGTETAGQATVHAFHRQRIAGAPGLCYTTAGGAAPAGWLPTINHNWNMVAGFNPRLVADNPGIRVNHHFVSANEGARSAKVRDFLAHNYGKKPP